MTRWREEREHGRDNHDAVLAAMDTAGHAVVLWKPICLYCERLLRAVGADPRVTWVNVWADPAANRAVRDLNDGNELTPTALVGDAVLRNPNGAELLAALGSDAESRDG